MSFMLLSQTKHKKIEDYIIETLNSGGETGPTLLAAIEQKDPSISKETFYRILRTLLKEEVINKHNKTYELNRHWLQRMYRFSKKHIEVNRSTDTDNILSFKEGDKITYRFKNPNSMGIYWAHTYDMLFEKHDPRIPILIHHPHEWLIHTRTDSESFFLNRFEEDKKLVLFSVGGTSSLDLQFKKKWSGKFRHIELGTRSGLKKTEYINVLGDFIFKISMSARFAEDLDTFFETHKEITPENKKELEFLCNRNEPARMIFIRSKKEATLWRTRFKKDFFIPKEYRATN